MAMSTVSRSASRLLGLHQSPVLRARNFSFSSTLASRRQVLVELTDDVKGLGQTYQRMTINPGRARNELVPSGSARMIPWKRKAERVRFLQAGHSSRKPGHAQSDSSQSSQTPPDLLETLYSLPPSISFQRRTTTAEADTIYGSLTLSDVSGRLQEEYGLQNQDVQVSWNNDSITDERLRQLGRYDCIVKVRGYGQETAPLVVQVARLDE